MIKRIIAKLRQMHKRKGFILLLLAFVSVFVAIAITMLATFRLDLMARNRQVEFSFPRQQVAMPVLGTGVNLKNLPLTNIIEDPSFEPHVFSVALDVYGGGEDFILVSNAEARPGVYGEGFFVGANARINTYTSNGVTQKKTGTVTKYSPNLAGDFIRIPTIGDLPFESKVNAYASKGASVILVGDNGIVLSGANTQSPSIEFVGVNENIICASSNDSSFFVATQDGSILSSEDGITWQIWGSPVDISINAIAASNDAVVAVGDNGLLLIGYDGEMYQKQIELSDDIVDIIFDGNQFVAVTNSGKIIVSSNSVFWKIISETNEKYTGIEYGDFTYALTTENKSLLLYSNINEEYVSEFEFENNIIDVALLSRSKVFVVDENNILFETSIIGGDWEESRAILPSFTSKIFAHNDQEVIAASQFNNIYISELVTEIVIDSRLVTLPFQPGDICYLTIEYPEIPSSLLDTSIIESKEPWQIFGAGEGSKIIRQGASAAGVGVMRLSGSIEDDTILSQKIGYNNLANILIPGNFYQFSVWLRVDELTDEPVMAWVSGPFTSIGVEFKNVGTSWKKYTYKFSFPKNISTAQSAMARFNIGIKGNTNLYVDKVHFGEVSQEESMVNAQYIEMISQINPSIVRLDFLQLGTFETMPNRWAYDLSLEQSLDMTLQTNIETSPWIVIDSAMSESELRNLIEYLSGSITTAFGRLRLENGSSLPWMTVFSKFYFEFTDENDLLRNDVMKSVHVNNLIDIITSTPYYNDYRNKITFIDGTTYDDGIMLSKADYNSTDLRCQVLSNPIESINASLNEYRSLIPRNPDRPSLTPYNLIRSVNIYENNGNLTTAGATIIMLDLLGRDSGTALMTIPKETRNINSPLGQASKIASSVAKGEYLELISSSGISQDINVKGYAFRTNGKIIFAFASITDSPASISLNISQTMQDGIMTKIDSTGNNIDVSSIKRSNKNETILPGQVILIEIDE